MYQCQYKKINKIYNYEVFLEIQAKEYYNLLDLENILICDLLKVVASSENSLYNKNLFTKD